MDGAVFARVASGADGRIVRGAGCLVTRLRCIRAGLFGRGRGLLLGTFRNKRKNK